MPCTLPIYPVYESENLLIIYEANMYGLSLLNTALINCQVFIEVGKDDIRFCSMWFANPHSHPKMLLRLSTQTRLFLNPFWVPPVSDRLALLPFGIVVARSLLGLRSRLPSTLLVRVFLELERFFIIDSSIRRQVSIYRPFRLFHSIQKG